MAEYVSYLTADASVGLVDTTSGLRQSRGQAAKAPPGLQGPLNLVQGFTRTGSKSWLVGSTDPHQGEKCSTIAVSNGCPQPLFIPPIELAPCTVLSGSCTIKYTLGALQLIGAGGVISAAP
jgi:hypothetical protein